MVGEREQITHNRPIDYVAKTGATNFKVVREGEWGYGNKWVCGTDKVRNTGWGELEGMMRGVIPFTAQCAVRAYSAPAMPPRMSLDKAARKQMLEIDSVRGWLVSTDKYRIVV